MSAPWELEFEAMMARLLDGSAGAPNLAELEQIFTSHPETINVYVRLMTLDTHARQFVKSNPRIVGEQAAAVGSGAVTSDAVTSGAVTSDAVTSDAVAQPSERRDAAAAARSEEDAPPVRSPVLGFLGGAVDYVNHSRRLMFLLVAVMLSGWFVFQVGSVLLGRWLVGDAPVAQQGPDHQGAPGQKPSDGGLALGEDHAHGDATAWLSGSLGCRWQIVAAKAGSGSQAGADYWEIGTPFTSGQQVKLVAGLGEITFRSGAKIVVSAPAQFAVTSPLQTELQVGKLTARVPHDPAHQSSGSQGATGFTVNTPAGDVVDLGTEFGVEVTPDHKLDVQVFVGEVKVNSSSDGGGAEAGEPGVRVTAGKTVHVEPGQPPTVAESKDKDRFHRDLKIDSDSNDKQVAAYLDFVRQLKPVVWLRMEGKDGERKIHDEMGNPDGKLQWDGAGNAFVEGRVGKGLWLRGVKLRDYALFADYPKAEHGKLSVSAWVYADSRPGWAMIADNWGDNVYGQFHFGLCSATSASGVDLSVQISQRDGKYLLLREGADHPFPLNEWQHVAFVSDGTTLRLYREGREVGSLKHDGLLCPAPLRSLAIGAKTDNSGTTISAAAPGNWSGKLDEIAIFNEALAPEQIKKLAAAPPR